MNEDKKHTPLPELIQSWRRSQDPAYGDKMADIIENLADSHYELLEMLGNHVRLFENQRAFYVVTKNEETIKLWDERIIATKKAIAKAEGK